MGCVNSTVITNSASLISQPGFFFVRCNFAVDFGVNTVFMYVEQKQKKKTLVSLRKNTSVKVSGMYIYI